MIHEERRIYSVERLSFQPQNFLIKREKKEWRLGCWQWRINILWASATQFAWRNFCRSSRTPLSLSVQSDDERRTHAFRVKICKKGVFVQRFLLFWLSARKQKVLIKKCCLLLLLLFERWFKNCILCTHTHDGWWWKMNLLCGITRTNKNNTHTDENLPLHLVRAGVSIYLCSFQVRSTGANCRFVTESAHPHMVLLPERVPYFPADQTSIAAGKHWDEKARIWCGNKFQLQNENFGNEFLNLFYWIALLYCKTFVSQNIYKYVI